MTIIPPTQRTPATPKHEDLSVYGTGLIRHPLPGHPEFQGVQDGPNGPLVRLQDGDFVLRISDDAAIDRWLAQLAMAKKQLVAHRGRLAVAAARKNSEAQA